MKKNVNLNFNTSYEKFESELNEILEIFEIKNKKLSEDLNQLTFENTNSSKISLFKSKFFLFIKDDFFEYISQIKNEYFYLIEKIKKKNLENEILIDEYHFLNKIISDLELQNENFLKEKKILKETEKAKKILEDCLLNKNYIIDKNNQVTTDLYEKINILKIEIEELQIFNDELKNNISIITEKFEIQQIEFKIKNKEFVDFKKNLSEVKNLNEITNEIFPLQSPRFDLSDKREKIDNKNNFFSFSSENILKMDNIQDKLITDYRTKQEILNDTKIDFQTNEVYNNKTESNFVKKKNIFLIHEKNKNDLNLKKIISDGNDHFNGNSSASSKKIKSIKIKPYEINIRNNKDNNNKNVN